MAATDIFNLQYALLEKLAWPENRKKQNKQTNKKRQTSQTSQTSGSNSRTESCRVALTIRNDGTISLRTAFRL